jgi:hypothetical protein
MNMHFTTPNAARPVGRPDITALRLAKLEDLDGVKENFELVS